MHSPAVSVVVGTYQRGRFLRATLESVRDELREVPHEIVVVDGGSTDGTIEWLVRQKDVITVVQHNRGEWRGRPIPRRSWGYFTNLGFRATSGPVICMLSDDCLVVPGAIRSGLETLDERARSGETAGAVAFWWRDWPLDKAYRIGLTFGGRMFVNHGLFVRSALEDVGYVDEEAFSFYHADGDLSLRLSEAGWKCVPSDGSYVEHYADANPTVRTSNLERQESDWRAYRERWEHLGKPERDWLEKRHDDPHGTVRKYWGPLRASRSFRLARRAVPAARARAQALRAR